MEKEDDFQDSNGDCYTYSNEHETLTYYTATKQLLTNTKN